MYLERMYLERMDGERTCLERMVREHMDRERMCLERHDIGARPPVKDRADPSGARHEDAARGKGHRGASGRSSDLPGLLDPVGEYHA